MSDNSNFNRSRSFVSNDDNIKQRASTCDERIIKRKQHDPLSIIHYPFLLLCLLLPSIQLSGQEFWKDKQVYTVGTEPHTCTHYTFPDQASALEGKHEESPYYKSLGGQWKFNWVARPADKPEGFHEPSYNVDAWKEIPVPSCWERQGYGVPSHRAIGILLKAGKIKIPTVPKNDNPVGSYRTTFEVPAN